MGDALAGFSGELRETSQMSALRDQMAQLVGAMQQTLAEQLDQAVEQTCKQVDTLAHHLREALSQALADDLDQLRSALADKARQVTQLQSLVDLIETSSGRATP